MDEAASAKPQPTAFVSYSRADARLAKMIHDGLAARGCRMLIDVEAIAVAEEWRPRINDMIRQADAMVVLMSPAWLASEICQWELGRALSLSKRLVPIVDRDTPAALVPEQIRHLNWLTLDETEGPEFESALDQLSDAVNIDIAWVREHSRLVDLADRWEHVGRPDAMVLRAEAIEGAMTWMARRMEGAPAIPDVLHAFLAAGRAREDADRSRLDLTAHKAGLIEAEACFEVAMGHLERKEPRRAAEYMFKALATSRMIEIPDGYATSPLNPGWAKEALYAAAVIAPTLPRRDGMWDLSGLAPNAELNPFVWIDQGGLVAGVAEGKLVTMDLRRGLLQIGDLQQPVKALGAAGLTRRFAAIFETSGYAIMEFDVEGVPHFQMYEHDTNGPYSAIGLTPDGVELVVARCEDDQVVVRRFSWDASLRGLGEFGIFNPEGLEPEVIAPRVDGGVLLKLGRSIIHFDEGGRRLAEVVCPGEAIFSSDGGEAAAVEYDLVKLYDFTTASGEPHFTVLEGASGMIRQVAFVADSVVSIDQAGRLTEWRRKSLLERDPGLVGTAGLQARANRIGRQSQLDGIPRTKLIAPHPIGRAILASAPGRVEKWILSLADVPTQEIPGTGAVMRCACEATLEYMIAATERGIYLKPGAHSEWQTLGPREPVRDAALAGDCMVVARDHGALVIVGLDGRVIDQHEFRSTIHAVVLAGPPPCIVVGLEDGSLWMVEDGKKVLAAELGLGAVRRLRFDRESGHIAIACRDGATGHEPPAEGCSGVAVVSFADRKIRWRNETIYPFDLDLMFRGRGIAVATTGETVFLSADSGERFGEIVCPWSDPSKPQHVTSVCFAPGDASVFMGCWDGTIAYGDFKKRIVRKWVAHDRPVTCLAIDTRGQLLSSTLIETPVSPAIRCWEGFDSDFLQYSPLEEDWPQTLYARFEAARGSLAMTQAE